MLDDADCILCAKHINQREGKPHRQERDMPDHPFRSQRSCPLAQAATQSSFNHRCSSQRGRTHQTDIYHTHLGPLMLFVGTDAASSPTFTTHTARSYIIIPFCPGPPANQSSADQPPPTSAEITIRHPPACVRRASRGAAASAASSAAAHGPCPCHQQRTPASATQRETVSGPRAWPVARSCRCRLAGVTRRCGPSSGLHTSSQRLSFLPPFLPK